MENGSTRYYVHGDQMEGQAKLFFCKLCDMFVSKSHFDSDHPTANHFAEFLLSRKAWEKLVKEGTSQTRPPKARNILE